MYPRKILVQKATKLGIPVNNDLSDKEIENSIKAFIKNKIEADPEAFGIGPEANRKRNAEYVYVRLTNHHPDKASMQCERYAVATDNEIYVADVPLRSGSQGVWLQRAIINGLKNKTFVQKPTLEESGSAPVNAEDFNRNLKNNPKSVVQHEFTIVEIPISEEQKQEFLEKILKEKQKLENV